MKTTNKPVLAGCQTLHCVGHCLYRSEKSRVYYAIVKRAGKQIKRSLKTTDKELAKRRLAEFQEKAARLNTDEDGRILFEDLAKRWLHSVVATMKGSSYERQEQIVKSLNRVFAGIPVRNIGRQQIEKWVAERGREVTARTFNYNRQTLIRILDYALESGLILENPARKVKRLKQLKHKVVIPTKEQFKKMLEAIRSLKVTAHEAADLCEFLAYSGCRVSEATAMLWGDVDFELKSFTVTGGERGTKNNEVRVVPLFPSLEQFLLRLRDSLMQRPRAEDRIFSILNAKKAMTTACHAAGLPRFTHHHMRHFFTSNAIEAGIDFKAIAAWLGHKDGGILVAKTYGHLRDEHSTAMAKRMTFNANTDNNTAPSNVVRMQTAS